MAWIEYDNKQVNLDKVDSIVKGIRLVGNSGGASNYTVELKYRRLQSSGTVAVLDSDTFVFSTESQRESFYSQVKAVTTPTVITVEK